MELCKIHPYCTRRVMLAGEVLCWLCYQKIPYKAKLEKEKEFICGECSKPLSNADEYHVKWKTCDSYCFGKMVGVYS